MTRMNQSSRRSRAFEKAALISLCSIGVSAWSSTTYSLNASRSSVRRINSFRQQQALASTLEKEELAHEPLSDRQSNHVQGIGAADDDWPFKAKLPLPIAPDISNVARSSDKIVHREYYDIQAWRDGWRTVDTEECYDLTGTFPSDLTGTFVQNGPAKFKVGNDLVLHPFDADGMLRAVTFKDGKAWFRNRFVETTGYLREKQANKILHRGVFGTRKSPSWTNVMDVNLKNVANTHVLYHNDRLYCLWDAGAPVEVDPLTLKTINPHVTHYGDRFGAHYKEDPRTKTICSFGLHPGLPNPNNNHRLVVVEHSAHGKLLHRQEYTLPGLAMGHDMALTDRYYVFLHPPCKMDLADFLLGRKGPAQCTQFDPTGSTTAWLIPRGGGPEIGIQLPLPPVFCTHVSNAFENDQGHIVVDAVVADSMKICDGNSGVEQTRPIWEDMNFDDYPAFRLVRYTLDPVTRKLVSSRVLSGDTGHLDFPIMHPENAGQPYKYVYCNTGASADKNAPPQGLAKFDVETGKLLEKWLPEPDEYLSEVVIAPKGNAIAEDDVYLVATLIHSNANSKVVVFDGSDITRGPIGQAQLRQRLPHALHGSFLAGYTPDLTQQVRDSF
ncbi:hypothetical protein MPSEU_000115400 [Mayamaea pseudoterrestris]|nr:hypothetical protein MPSEU_000115400 [Mayamaea pseudoterrestris]